MEHKNGSVVILAKTLVSDDLIEKNKKNTLKQYFVLHRECKHFKKPCHLFLNYNRFTELKKVSIADFLQYFLFTENLKNFVPKSLFSIFIAWLQCMWDRGPLIPGH